MGGANCGDGGNGLGNDWGYGWGNDLGDDRLGGLSHSGDDRGVFGNGTGVVW
jgi:hypothetical protein